MEETKALNETNEDTTAQADEQTVTLDSALAGSQSDTDLDAIIGIKGFGTVTRRVKIGKYDLGRALGVVRTLKEATVPLESLSQTGPCYVTSGDYKNTLIETFICANKWIIQRKTDLTDFTIKTRLKQTDGTWTEWK